MRSQCCHRTMLTMWDHYDSKIMTSPLWDLCEVTVIQVEHITMMSHFCHNMMSQIHKMTTSPWGHSVVTVWCHRYMRWPQHNEVTVLSQDDAHHVRSLWYLNYDITSVRFVWGHSDRSWAHHLEVTVLSQYDVTGTQGDHITMRSQCCHMAMLTLWGHYDVLMISKLWHHHVWDVCYVTVTNVYHITMRSQCCLSFMSQVHEMTTSSWGHSAVTRRCPPCEIIMMSSWYQNYDITCVRCLLDHSDKSLPHHCEGTVLS